MNKKLYWLIGGIIGSIIGFASENLFVCAVSGFLIGLILPLQINFLKKKDWSDWLKGGTIAVTGVLIWVIVSIPFGEGGRGGQAIFLLPLFLVFPFILGAIIGLIYGKIKNITKK